MRMSSIHLSPVKQKGASIVTAIFLVVVLALLAIGMVSVLTTSQQSISQELTSAKAYMASRSCLEWGMYQAVYDADPWLNNPHTINFNASGLIKTSCAATIVNITADGLSFFTLDSLGRYGNIVDAEYSQRNLQLQFQP